MTKATQQLDPLDVNNRLYRQLARLLDDLEAEPADPKDALSIHQRVEALTVIGRIQTVFMGLRKEDTDAAGTPGSAVRKFSKAFETNAGGGRARRPRPGRAAAAAADDDDEDAGA